MSCQGAAHRMDESRVSQSKLDFRWDDNAIEVIGLAIKFKGRADVKSKVRCRLLQDFGGRNGYPRAIDLHLVVAIDLSP